MSSPSSSSDATSPTSSVPASTSSHAAAAYSYKTSKIVRTAIAVAVIVLGLSALVLFFKISSWIRVRQRLRRQHYLAAILQSEQRASAYEIAAWSDEPGQAPAHGGGGPEKKTRKERRAEIKAQKRGGANAHAVHEWEGVAG